MTDDATRAALAVAEHLESFTYGWSSELELQDAISVALPPFVARREESLSRRDRPDFIVEFCGLNIAVEVKIKGARNAVLRQLGRYAEHDDIAAIVLASGKRTLLSGIPNVLHGKPVAVAMLAGVDL